MPNNAEKAIANNKANTPMIKPIMANNTFIAITQIIPSISQLKINPGNLIDKLAHQINTSPIYDPEMMQYNIEKMPYPAITANKTDNAGWTLSRNC